MPSFMDFNAGTAILKGLVQNSQAGSGRIILGLFIVKVNEMELLNGEQRGSKKQEWWRCADIQSSVMNAQASKF